MSLLSVPANAPRIVHAHRIGLLTIAALRFNGIARARKCSRKSSELDLNWQASHSAVLELIIRIIACISMESMVGYCTDPKTTLKPEAILFPFSMVGGNLDFLGDVGWISS
jgi:hypothetical protein